MAKPNTTGKDYGHKTYMNTTSYPEAIGRPSDKQYDNRTKRPHSDDKKPYYDDEYPEMEHFWTPYDPPNLVPPGIPDDPRIPPNQPDFPGGSDPGDPDLGEPDFTGCVFTVPTGPSVIKAGETTFHGMGITANDPLVSLKVNFGPVKVLTSANAVNECLRKLTPNCIVSAQAETNITDALYPHKIGDLYLAQIVGTTSRGFTCVWDLFVFKCPPPTAIAWDYENSAETINQSGEVTVYITGGQGPFNWAVSGQGYSLAYSKTGGRSNILYGEDTSCGSASISVTDACDDVTIGFVRNTTGHWDEKASQCGLPLGDPDVWNIDCIGSPLENLWPVNATVTEGNKKQYHKETIHISSAARGYSTTEGECESIRAGAACGTWATPCLTYPSVWTLTKPPATCAPSVRWQGDYEECAVSGLYITRPCVEDGLGNWYYLRANHYEPSIDLRYWEWECI